MSFSRPTTRSGLTALALCATFAAPVHAITGDTATVAFVNVGNGVQVTADWVFTAQHAVLNPGDTFSNGLGDRTVAARYDAPGSGVFPANDFALLRLVPSATLVTELQVLGTAYPDGPLGPLDVTIVSAANAGPARGFAFTTVSAATDQLDPDDAGPLGPVTVNYLLSLDSVVHVESGDSGGALFFGQVFDSSVLLGISSALLTDDLNQPTGSGFVQPAAYRAWIDQVMLADTADGQQVQWVSAVPEPATWALWAVGVAGLVVTARRRSAGQPACSARSRSAAAIVAS